MGYGSETLPTASLNQINKPPGSSKFESIPTLRLSLNFFVVVRGSLCVSLEFGISFWLPTNHPEMTQNEVKNFKPIKKIESKTNSSIKISNDENYDDSSKNLANFFNGEVIDLDE